MSRGVSVPMAVTQNARVGCDREQPRFTRDSGHKAWAGPPPWREGHCMAIAKQRVRDKWNALIDERHIAS